MENIVNQLFQLASLMKTIILMKMVIVKLVQ